jgi:hypothetical protein
MMPTEEEYFPEKDIKNRIDVWERAIIPEHQWS